MSFVAVAVTSAVVGGTAAYLGAKQQAKATKKAAELQAETANRATDSQERMFQQNREDMAPWQNAGQGALYSLTDLMGINVPIDPVTGQPAMEYSAAKSLGPAGAPTGAAGSEVSYLPRTDQFGSLTQPFNYSNWKDPGYDFRFAQGQKALERSAAARGDLFSGATGKAMTQYGQDYGSNEYANAYNRWNQRQDTLYNRLAGLAGTGQNATSQIGDWGANTAANIGNIQTNAANNIGNTYQNAAAARASGYAGIANAVNSRANNYMFYKLMKK